MGSKLRKPRNKQALQDEVITKELQQKIYATFLEKHNMDKNPQAD